MASNQIQDYVPPDQLVGTMSDYGTKKAGLALRDLLIRGFMSGMILGFSTSVALTIVSEGSSAWLGALLFPVGFVLLMLLGYELVTGNFALVPVALFDRRVTGSQLVRNWSWVFVANLVGGVTFAALFYAATTKFGQVDAGAIGEVIVARAESKTLAYAEVGTAAGVGAAFVKAVLCNWMVATGTVMGLISTSVIGKIAAMWLPIFAFFALGLEHSVVNMFLIPAGILFGDTVTVADWWQWNQVTVTIGNAVGAFFLVALVMYSTHRPREN